MTMAPCYNYPSASLLVRLFVEAAPDVITERVSGFLSPLFNQPSGRTMTTGNPPLPACCSRSPSLKSEYSHGYASRALFYVSWVCVFVCFFLICRYILIEIGSAFPLTNERRPSTLSALRRQSANCLRCTHTFRPPPPCHLGPGC